MVHLLQVSVILTAAVLVVGGLVLYGQYYNNTSNSVEHIIEIISSNATTYSNGDSSGGGSVIVTGNQSTNGPIQNAPLNNITLPTNVQILQNEINNTRYTAILITENLSQTS